MSGRSWSMPMVDEPASTSPPGQPRGGCSATWSC
jgi:hypothetical protein